MPVQSLRMAVTWICAYDPKNMIDLRYL